MIRKMSSLQRYGLATKHIRIRTIFFDFACYLLSLQGFTQRAFAQIILNHARTLRIKIRCRAIFFNAMRE